MAGNHEATRRVVVQSSYNLAANLEFESTSATTNATPTIEVDKEEFRAPSGGTLNQEVDVPTSQDKADSRISKHDKEKRSHRRGKRRRLEAEANGLGSHPVKGVARKKAWRMADDAHVTLMSADLAEMKVAEGGWLGNRTPMKREDERCLDELLRSGYALVNWDGM